MVTDLVPVYCTLSQSFRSFRAHRPLFPPVWLQHEGALITGLSTFSSCSVRFRKKMMVWIKNASFHNINNITTTSRFFSKLYHHFTTATAMTPAENISPVASHTLRLSPARGVSLEVSGTALCIWNYAKWTECVYGWCVMSQQLVPSCSTAGAKIKAAIVRHFNFPFKMLLLNSLFKYLII